MKVTMALGEEEKERAMLISEEGSLDDAIPFFVPGLLPRPRYVEMLMGA